MGKESGSEWERRDVRGKNKSELTVCIEITFSAQYSSTALILFRMVEESIRTLADPDHHPQTGFLRFGSRGSRGGGWRGGWQRGSTGLLVGDHLVAGIIDALGFDFAALPTGDTEIRYLPVREAAAIHVDRVRGAADALVGLRVAGRGHGILAAGFLILLEITFKILSGNDNGKRIT